MTREDPQARAERITAELRAATAEAAGVLKDLTAVIKSAIDMVDKYAAHEVSRVMNAHLRRAQEISDQWHAKMKADGIEAMAKMNAAHQVLLTELSQGFDLVLKRDDGQGPEETINLTGTMRPKQ